MKAHLPSGKKMMSILLLVLLIAATVMFLAPILSFLQDRRDYYIANLLLFITTGKTPGDWGW